MSKSIVFLALAFILCWFIPVPGMLTSQAWHLSLVFFLALVLMMTRIIPITNAALICMFILVVTKTISLSALLEGYSYSIVWLIFIAFYITRGVINTQLSQRFAYMLISKVGRTQIGLGMGVVLLELLLAPFIPSSTARTGGIMYPIIMSLTRSVDQKHSRELGRFLVQLVFHGSNITSAMFISAMAANPLIVALARESGVHISWKIWALSASVPGILSLAILIVSLCYFFPGKNSMLNFREIAKEKLIKMGKFSILEKKMVVVLSIMVIGWGVGSFFSIPSFLVAAVGMLLMLVLRILSKEDLKKEKASLNLITWFPLLLVLGVQLNRTGVTHLCVKSLMFHIAFLSPEVIFILLLFAYIYIHYLFAGNSSQVLAIYVPCVSICLSVGIPPYIAALSFACASSLNGGLTHYTTGHAPLLFASGFFTLGEWWKWGLIVTSVIFATWVSICPLWWSYLQLY